MKVIALALASIVLSVLAQFLLKAGMSSAPVRAALAGPAALSQAWQVLRAPCVVAGLAVYVLGAAVWLAVLAEWDVSKAYPLVGLGFALTVLVGMATGEHVTWGRAAGVALICLGVLTVSRS